MTLVQHFSPLLLLILSRLSQCSINIYDEKNVSLTSMDDLSAAFGPRIPDEGLQGYVAVARPISACSKIDSPPSNASFVKKWIALIQRTPTIFGNCSFDLKVYNAQRAGFSAVIIFNSESENLIKMSSTGLYNIRIPSVFVGHSNGLSLMTAFTYANKTLVEIDNDDTDITYLLVPFICVVTICSIIAISFFVVKFAIHFYKIRKNRFPKSALKKIPTKKYQKSDKYDTCPICLNEYEEGVKIRILPCEHVYHIECIDKWLLRNNRFCPVCKRRVLPGGSDSDSESEAGNRLVVAENQPNEEDDTNESSRLLVNVRVANEDNISALTIINQNNQQNNDMSSLNNQMVTSATMSRELRSASSRYGSISSMNLAPNPATSSSNNNNNTEDAIENAAFESYEAGEASDSENDSERTVEMKPKPKKKVLDSKATPDFHSLVSSSVASNSSSIEEKPSKSASSDTLKKKKLNKIASNDKAKKLKAEVRKAKSSQINAQNINKIVEKLGDKLSQLVKTENELEAESSEEEALLPLSSSSSNQNEISANPEINDDQPGV